PLGLQVAGGIEHLLHARPAARAFVADDHHVTGLDPIAQDGLHRRLLALEHAGRPGERENARIHARGLHDAAVHGDVAVQHGEPAVLAVGMFHITDAALAAVEVQLAVTVVLAERLGRAHAARRRAIELLDPSIVRAPHVPARERLAQAGAVHGADI